MRKFKKNIAVLLFCLLGFYLMPGRYLDFLHPHEHTSHEVSFDFKENGMFDVKHKHCEDYSYYNLNSFIILSTIEKFISSINIVHAKNTNLFYLKFIQHFFTRGPPFLFSSR